ncbi:SH3 domain-containing protein [Sulfitobacter sp.]|uniref:SH3 domain-containing protein n=1 Tax=Sulfitobacter sp. TaxID=1903071 RepID=UPI003562F9E9
MTRFILLTFGFLGWTYYEMSGGADFEPTRPQMEANASETETVVAQTAPAAVEAPVKVAPAQKVAKVVPADTTPPGFSGSSASDYVVRASMTVDNAQAATQVAPVKYVPVKFGSSTSSTDTPAIIPSLIVPNDTGANIITSSATDDIRSVSGNRVNVRGGPGTDFGVVTRLVRGDAVEVIEDLGNGWVQMRAVDDGRVGWIADFLLTSS